MMTALGIVMLGLAADLVVSPIARGPVSPVVEPRQAVARSPAEWEALWKAHATARPAPAVDFSSEMVAAVFLGARPSGGFGVEITGARLDGETLVIHYVEQRPGRRDVVTQMLTSPFHIVRLPHHPGAVRFEAVPPMR